MEGKCPSITASQFLIFDEKGRLYDGKMDRERLCLQVYWITARKHNSLRDRLHFDTHLLIMAQERL